MKVAISPREYRNRVEAAVLEAIVAASIVEQDGVRSAVILSGDVADALVTIIAGLVATSDDMATTKDRQRFATKTSTLLRKRIEMMRRHVAVHGASFTTINGEGARA